MIRYSRYVGDINMRRGFLDKRGCIETTFRLKHEKDKEVTYSLTGQEGLHRDHLQKHYK